MSRVLVTGSAGFIGGYVVRELLHRGHEVIGIDNFSKYGPVTHEHDTHPRYELVTGDARHVDLLWSVMHDVDHVIAGAAMVGGISYFHEYAYDLLAENERITAATCDAAIAVRKARANRGSKQRLKVTFVSSSMVYESTDHWPSLEGSERRIAPPSSSYGFQKLAVEYFARAAWQQYGVPYTIVRPFNAVGVGEQRALGAVEITSGDVKLAMSHVVPDLVHKVLAWQGGPIHILGDGNQVRCYTYGGDVARGIAMAMGSPRGLCQSFNISTDERTTVLELLAAIWRKVHPGEALPDVVHDAPYTHDVQRRIPDVGKAARVLGFRASTTLSEALDVVIPWVRQAIEDGRL